MKLPCKPKYVDEAVPTWIPWRSGSSWNVCPDNDLTQDVFINLTEEQANKICSIQHAFKEQLVNYMCDWSGKQP